MGHAPSHRAAVVSLAAVALLTSAAPARAADPTTVECIAANDSAVKQRDAGKLLDARDTFTTCASPKCPASVRAECEKSLGEVNQALPTIVFEPKDAAGNDLLSPVKVSMDGKPLADKLDGRAISVDPGTHEFTFETSGQAPVKKTLLIHEAEKDRHEVVAFGGAAGGAAPAATPGATPAPAEASAAAPSQSAPASESTPPSAPSEGPTASGIELGIATGYMIPLGSLDGNNGDDMSNFINGAVPIRLHAGWRFLQPNIFVGGYVAYGFSSVPSGANTLGSFIGCGNGGISCSANVVLYGIEGEFHILPDRIFDPWVGLGFGYENATVNASGPGGSASISVGGFDFVTLLAGGDFKPLGNLGIGPFLGLTIGQYSGNVSETASNGTSSSPAITNSALHEWVTLGVRGVYDINLKHKQ